MEKIFKVKKDFNNTRLEKWFKINVLDLPNSLISKVIRKKQIKINDKKISSSKRVFTNDIIKVFNINNYKSRKKNFTAKYKTTVKEKKQYDKFVIEDNENFLVINKQSGVPVQAGTKSYKNIIDILKETKFFIDYKPYIVHRLDKETSGILIIAKNRNYAQLLTSLFRLRRIHKTYHAIVIGEVDFSKKTLIDNLIIYEKNKKNIQKAITHVKVLRKNNKFSLLELNPVTGRKHQIRKQLVNIGYPIVGDKKYFINKIRFNKNLMLHSKHIKFMIKDRKLNFSSPYPEYFDKFVRNQFKNF